MMTIRRYVWIFQIVGVASTEELNMSYASRTSLGFFCGRMLPADQGLKLVNRDHRVPILMRPPQNPTQHPRPSVVTSIPVTLHSCTCTKYTIPE